MKFFALNIVGEKAVLSLGFEIRERAEIQQLHSLVCAANSMAATNEQKAKSHAAAHAVWALLTTLDFGPAAGTPTGSTEGKS